MASLSDILTSAQNIATAINTALQGYLNVQGVQNSPNITAATLIKSSAGRVAVVSILTGGSAAGTIYDTNVATTVVRPVFTIPTTPGVIFVNMPTSYGILVVPGTGQAVTVSYS